MEYVGKGSLDKLLFEDNFNLTAELIFRIVRGIASGMAHLAESKLVHRDLAARNVCVHKCFQSFGGRQLLKN